MVTTNTAAVAIPNTLFITATFATFDSASSSRTVPPSKAEFSFSLMDRQQQMMLGPCLSAELWALGLTVNYLFEMPQPS